jgi:hypothetical protein
MRLRSWTITDAVLHGMPPHIAQLVAGHRDINTTMGYKAVYPEEAINGHRAFIARRRGMRPSEEYRTPTDEEWEESSATSNAANSPSAPAAAPTPHPASMSTVACARGVSTQSRLGRITSAQTSICAHTRRLLVTVTPSPARRGRTQDGRRRSSSNFSFASGEFLVRE